MVCFVYIVSVSLLAPDGSAVK
uniref:Uncharacterized protein n=1 Tax=Rhizophora mucronata TaxID=61149 RepID=A0A2P2QX41_RHIMU